LENLKGFSANFCRDFSLVFRSTAAEILSTAGIIPEEESRVECNTQPVAACPPIQVTNPFVPPSPAPSVPALPTPQIWPSALQLAKFPIAAWVDPFLHTVEIKRRRKHFILMEAFSASCGLVSQASKQNQPNHELSKETYV